MHMLTMIAIGDAYGIGFEFVERRNWPPNDLSGYYSHPKYNLPASHYTDDTQMSMAVAETILTHNLYNTWDFTFAESFLTVFHRDPRNGYASGFQKFLETTTTAEDFIKNINPKSKRNGAAMRACPLGCIKDQHRVIALAAIQASTTHNTLEGIISAQAVAIMVNEAIYNGASRKDMPRILAERFPDFDFQPNHTGWVECDGLMTVKAVVTALYNHDNTADILKACIDFGGDTDSTAAIAMGIASVCKDITNNLPQHLFDGLEKDKNGNNTHFGRPYLKRLDDYLTAFVKQQKEKKSL